MATRVVVAGGDARDAWLCQFLENQGFTVEAWGFSAPGIAPYRESGEPVAIFIGPMTGIDADGSMKTMDGRVILTPDFLARMAHGGLIAAGLIAAPVTLWAKRYGLTTVEYRNQTTFMWLNTVPTAEGAIRAAIGRSGFTLYHRPVGILGFGRVGAILALRLQSYGSFVEVFDRSVEKRAMASAMGFPVHPLDPVWCPPLDGLFNTIPAPVITREWIDTTDPAWIIDLASLPGGLAKGLETDSHVMARYESYLGVPGHIAPRRAAEIIWETLASILQENAVKATVQRERN
ncbi:dipicolinate synthase subunit DpsA [Sulfobacillus sp. hq2]|uniref:Hydroxyacid dehydrogenase n=1 Tax=Sulfobacillus thermotolerans TaxID=338644 RepID=A0ABN5GYV3_9FIRM|nr:dipicolinate synthase subunit DpsA [Sulfobacillus sp. hq2]AUW93717.1 hydroxyacid dehydrogenase [Sulfobacillus thermotolerans]MCY0908654.1 dipicolinate synthase subunit DpsA [Sulfobacillus thermotolerans]POB10963.1 hydroxyacid dehydrogenase [Sulfobacillus sp. hq2]